MTIYFYSTREPFGEFSNFSSHGIELDGQYWPTTEHYFQAQKFADAEYREKIRGASSPKQAAEWGRSRAVPLRADWEAIKEDVMYQAVRAKFETHAELKNFAALHRRGRNHRERARRLLLGLRQRRQRQKPTRRDFDARSGRTGAKLICLRG